MLKKSLAILLSLMLTLPAWSQGTELLTPAERALSMEYGIEPETMYAGSLVIRAILAIEVAAEAEAVERVTLSWSEGFKAGVLQEQAEIVDPWVYAIVGAVVGGGIIFLVMR